MTTYRGYRLSKVSCTQGIVCGQYEHLTPHYDASYWRINDASGKLIDTALTLQRAKRRIRSWSKKNPA